MGGWGLGLAVTRGRGRVQGCVCSRTLRKVIATGSEAEIAACVSVGSWACGETEERRKEREEQFALLCPINFIILLPADKVLTLVLQPDWKTVGIFIVVV